CIEHWIVGLFAPEAFHALSAREPDVRLAYGPLQERVDERRLADAGLARHEDDLALPIERFVEKIFEPGQRRVSAHDAALHTPRRSRRSDVGVVADPGDELVSAPRYRLDEERAITPVFQDLPDGEDVLLYDLRVDVGLRP